MNLSGKAINYWLQKEKVELENLLVICDDIALPLGTLRIKPKGNDGGHNGLADIIDKLGTIEFARLRFGIGNNFPKGKQVDYVLGEFNIEEQNIVNDRIVEVSDIIKSYVTLGLEKTMTIYNKKEYKYKNNKNEI
jgi:PTH1 family peptidyl-tRNA hydrolase